MMIMILWCLLAVRDLFLSPLTKFLFHPQVGSFIAGVSGEGRVLNLKPEIHHQLYEALEQSQDTHHHQLTEVLSLTNFWLKT